MEATTTSQIDLSRVPWEKDTPLLELAGVSAGYDESSILKNVSMRVPERKVVALLGRNGVGKTTLLNSILGTVSSTEGSFFFEGEPINKLNVDRRARLGIGYVPQGREIFPSLSVWENLNVSLRVAGKGSESDGRLEEVFELFPVVKEMLNRKGGVLSGGQQQQLSIARALLLKPKLLILDEPTEGIQPSIIDQIEDAILAIRRKGEMSIILVEQYIDFARNACDEFYILERGTVVLNGPIGELSEEVVARYLTI